VQTELLIVIWIEVKNRGMQPLTVGFDSTPVHVLLMIEKLHDQSGGTQEDVRWVYDRNFCGVSINLVRDGGQRERGSGGSSP
jgi:hypothetical protein